MTQLEIHLPLYTFSYCSALYFSLGVVHILMCPKGTSIYSSKVQAFPILSHRVHSLAKALWWLPAVFSPAPPAVRTDCPLLSFLVRFLHIAPEASHEVHTGSMNYSNERLYITPRSRQCNPNLIFCRSKLVVLL